MSSANTFQGMARSILARNRSRRVTLRLPANSASEKLNWLIGVFLIASHSTSYILTGSSDLFRVSLAEDGTAQSDETMQLCLKEARDEIDSVRTRIDEILFYKWDPIRLSNSNISRDEYASYVKGVFEIALNSTSPDSLADHLTMISTEYMGVLGNRETDVAVAALIFSIVQDYDYYPNHLVVDID